MWDALGGDTDDDGGEVEEKVARHGTADNMHIDGVLVNSFHGVGSSKPKRIYVIACMKERYVIPCVV